MNRLNNQRVYLAGPMDRVQDRGATWRDNITPILLSMGIKVLNPIHKPIDIGSEDNNVHEIKKSLKMAEKYDALSVIMKEIRNIDLRMVDISDFVIANLDLDIHPCGTLEEIFWANRQKKPVIIRMEQGKKHTPDWLFGTVPHQMIFSTWDEIHSYLSHIDSAPHIDSQRRWYFFNIKP